MSEEFQNAFQSARQQHDFNPHSEKIEALLAQDRFVVVVDYPTHCPYTDAVMGDTRYCLSDFPTRQEAADFLLRHDLEKDDEWASYDILTRVEEEETGFVMLPDYEDIPF